MLRRADATLRHDAATEAPETHPASPKPPVQPQRSEPPSATFVVVPAPASDDEERACRPLPRPTLERIAIARDTVLREALAGAPIFLTASVLASAYAAWDLATSTRATTFITSLMLVQAAWLASIVMASRRPKRHAQGGVASRRFAFLSVLNLAGLAAAPWLLSSAPASVAGGAFGALILMVAASGAITAAALRPVAVASAMLPLSLAISGDGDMRFAGVAAAIVCGLLAAWRHRAWRRALRQQTRYDEELIQLRSERDTALRADEDKSRFLAIASHDLRQPVHALGLFAATLEKRLVGSAEEPLARNMIRSIEGLDRSFNAMLDISRLDAGTIEPNIQPFPLRDLFRRLHMHFAGQAEMSGLGLRFSPGGKSVSSDPQLLERILGNLVQNAIKYTETGGVVVVARSTETHVNIEIWDTGVGIRAADLPRVFDEFYQVGRSERARAQGLGIGLAIVKRLAMLLGHQLTISSRPGRGTMFRIGIRIGGLQDIQDVTAPADTLPMPLPQSRTVLVIDDEEAIREGLALLLDEWGYQAVAAGSIAQAQRVLATLDAPPDLILSDLHLGDGPDGIEAIAAVRAWCGHDVTAVLITGDTSAEEMRRAGESGHPVLFKPVQPRRLYNVLRGLSP